MIGVDPRLGCVHPHYPFRVTYHTLYGGRIRLTLDSPAALSRPVLDALALLTALAHEIQRAEEGAARDHRLAAVHQAWERRKNHIRSAYRKLRGLGVAHRAAVLAVSEQPAWADLRAHRWTRADFSSVIGPASLYRPPAGRPAPVLRAVPSLCPNPSPRRRRSRLAAGAGENGRAAS